MTNKRFLDLLNTMNSLLGKMQQTWPLKISPLLVRIEMESSIEQIK